MSYLLDRKNRRKKFSLFLFLIILFLTLFYFRLGILGGLSYASGVIFRPVLVLDNAVHGNFRNLGSYFLLKSSLNQENENLKLELLANKIKMANYDSVLGENILLKEMLGRIGGTRNLVLSAILGKPNQSLHDTLIIDAGAKVGIAEGDSVFAFGDVPLGRVVEVGLNSSKVILFSNSGEKTQVVLSDKNIFMEVVGRGGGNFEMILPRDLSVFKGDTVILPGILPRVLGVVETIISDPRDPIQKALLVAPVNIQEIKFVEVET